MSAPTEVLITSDASGQLWNACIWDLNSGTSLTSYKGEASTHRGLCLLGKQYLLGAVINKPLIHVWALQRKDQYQMKMVCPGRVTALAVSPDGVYCAAAIAEKIHIWQVCTGHLLAIVSRHYQNINVIRFTDSGSHFVSAGEDNLIIVWSMSSILSTMANRSQKPEPSRIWSSHSLPVTDIHVGRGGNRARVVSSSLDQTVRVWDMVTGGLLHTVVFNTSITSVVMDASEMRLFAGGSTGDIYTVNMYGQPIRSERHIETDSEAAVSCLKGHSKKVTCLSVSLDGRRLVSGSDDCTARIWDVVSGQCVRTLNHKGSLTNVELVPTPASIVNPQIKPTIPIMHFQRALYTEDDSNEDGMDVRITADMDIPKKNRETLEMDDDREIPDKAAELSRLKGDVSRLSAVNRELYTVAVSEILLNKTS